VPDAPEDMFYAFGGHGQFIVVIPSLDTIIVRLGHDSEHSDVTLLPKMVRMITSAFKP
jgi:hypothetical protein